LRVTSRGLGDVYKRQPLLQSATLFLNEMATFNDAGIDDVKCLHS
jgi:hypothetical protein